MAGDDFVEAPHAVFINGVRAFNPGDRIPRSQAEELGLVEQRGRRARRKTEDRSRETVDEDR